MGGPIFPSHPSEQITAAFTRLVNTYQTFLSDFGATPQLVIGTDTTSNAINAFASSGTTVTVNLALGELIGDSPSELAFVVGHELGHIYQQRTGKFAVHPDKEWDADVWGMWMALGAGYDPYAAAGVLGNGMATGTANLGVQQWEDAQLSSDAHGSSSTRIDNLTNMLESGVRPVFERQPERVYPIQVSRASVLPLAQQRAAAAATDATDEPGELNRFAGCPIPGRARRARWSCSRSTGGPRRSGISSSSRTTLSARA